MLQMNAATNGGKDDWWEAYQNKKRVEDSKITKGEGFFYIYKEIQLNEKIHKIIIFFEERPFKLRKLEILNDLEVITFSILSPNHNPDLNNEIFSLANPSLS